MWEAIAMIIVALIGGSVSIYLHQQNNKLTAQNKLLQTELNALNYEVIINLQDANKLQQIITQLMNETKVDRFILFLAENGGTKPLTFTTAILEHHQNNMHLRLSIGAVNKYVKFRFDNPYLSMLQQIEYTNDGVFLDIEKMNPCKLKNIYNAEQINYSAIFFNKREKLTPDKHLIFYSSFATHSINNFTNNEKTQIAIAASAISSLEFKVIVN